MPSRKNTPLAEGDKLKSSMHSKITGNFGEHLILYMLSRAGLEAMYVDHTGIDLVAVPGKNSPVAGRAWKAQMGISVKSRSRYVGTEDGYIGIPPAHLVKVEETCHLFKLKAHMAIVIASPEMMQAFFMSMDKFREVADEGKTKVIFRMKERDVEKYKADSGILHLEMQVTSMRWV